MAVPLALHYGEPLANNPAVAALLRFAGTPRTWIFGGANCWTCCAHPISAFPALPDECVDLLDRLSMAISMVTGGRRTWLEALDAAKAQPTIFG